ncbi:hypothetical protein IT409_02905, partial [Candidatus Falkowbacteria bacterium]|nr:hypothetical protein [Candidatus Falkowbacteria bacterium]
EGKNVESRAGVIVEDGNKFIVALKDLNGVWILDPANDSDIVVKKYWNVGGSPSLLHDGFLTPDATYFMVAAQDANNVWVLDVKNGKAVTNVPTGTKPHTGPGAYAFNTVYVPSLGEGKITAIEYGTWKVKKYIETAGPGLFVRSYNKDPKYPYVWADTAFFDGADEIYVIDARTQEIVKTLIPTEGKMTIHPEFTYDGKFVYVASSEGNSVIVYDAHTFAEVTRIDAHEPSGIFNVGTRVEEPGL